MRVLVAHNAYLERGGEDAVVEAEVQLLQQHGHAVVLYRRSNTELADTGPLRAAREALWSPRSARDLGALLRDFRPDVVHVHNTFPLLSPSVYWPAAAAGVAVVQTLHNFRMICPQAMLLRAGRVCEDCVGKVPWRAVVHACYRGSRAQSTVAAASLALHRRLGTATRRVHRYVALNDFCRRKFIAGGLPQEAIAIKPNFIDGGAAPRGGLRHGGLFVGRLSPEKGLAVLAAASRVGGVGRVCVVGDGSQRALAQQEFAQDYLGPRPLDEVLALMRTAAYLVVPSLWYENFPRTIVEAFASGLPVIASRLGALAEIVRHERTGLLFEPGDAADLGAKMAWAEAHPGAMLRMGEAARAEYEARYTPERNHAMLMAIYAEAIAACALAGAAA